MRRSAIIVLSVVLLAVFSVSCNTDVVPGYDGNLYLEGNDSAFARIDRYPLDSVPSGRRFSRYALEHCRLRGESHGSRREDEVSALLSLGRYKLSRNDVRAAARSYSEAYCRYKDVSPELRSSVCLEQAAFYEGLSVYDMAEEKYMEAAACSLESGDTLSSVSSALLLARMYITSGNISGASVLLDSLEGNIPDLPIECRSSYDVMRMELCLESGLGDEAAFRLQRYLAEYPDDSTDWLGVCGIFICLDSIKEASSSLEKFRHYNPDYAEYQDYHLYNSDILEMSGEYASAYESFNTYMKMQDSLYIRSLGSDGKFIEEQYARELDIEKDRTVILISVLVIVLLAISGVVLFRSYRFYRSECASLSGAGETVRARIDGLKSELETLKTLDMTGDGGVISSIVSERIRILNKCIALMVSPKKGSRADIASELRNAYGSRQEFMASLQGTFGITHPGFISFLKERGLTDVQIQLCCLYALGLRGKDIMNYVSRSSHYNESSSIRSMLGLTVHDTNLSIYIRNLVSANYPDKE